MKADWIGSTALEWKKGKERAILKRIGQTPDKTNGKKVNSISNKAKTDGERSRASNQCGLID